MTYSSEPLFVPYADPWAPLDGRLNAPRKTPQYPTILNTYHPGGVVDARYFLGAGGGYQPPWHVAGVDYAVGINPSVFPLKDPATISDPNVTVNSGTHQIIVTGPNITLDGYDFSLAGGWGFLTEDANTIVSNSKFVIGANAHVPIWGFHGFNASNLSILYCELDGAFIQPGGSEPSTMINMEGPGITIKYCLCQNGFGDMVDLGAGGAITVNYNLFKDNGSVGTHPDVLQIASGTYGPTDYRFNTIYEGPASVDGQGVILSGNPTWSMVGQQEIAYNTFMAVGVPGPDANGMHVLTQVDAGNLAANATAIVHDNFVDLTHFFSTPIFGAAGGLAPPQSRYWANKSMLDGSLFPGTP